MSTPAEKAPETLDGILSPKDFIATHSVYGCDVYVKSRQIRHIAMTDGTPPVPTEEHVFIILRCRAHHVESSEGVDHLSTAT